MIDAAMIETRHGASTTVGTIQTEYRLIPMAKKKK